MKIILLILVGLIFATNFISIPNDWIAAAQEATETRNDNQEQQFKVMGGHQK